MKIDIMIKGRYRNRRDVTRLFNRYAKRIVIVMNRLSRDMKFKLPKRIILRPMYVRKCDWPYSYNGRVIYDDDTGWQVLMNIENCLEMPDKGIGILYHECAHIADYLTRACVPHDKRFKLILAACKAVKS